MKQFIKNQFNNLLRSQGREAGIVPVKNPVYKEDHLAEVKQLGVMDRELSTENRHAL